MWWAMPVWRWGKSSSQQAGRQLDRKSRQQAVGSRKPDLVVDGPSSEVHQLPVVSGLSSVVSF